MEFKDILIYALIILVSIFFTVFVYDVFKNSKGQPNIKYIFGSLIGLVTNFFDTLGIGSFAPTTAAIKVSSISDDRLIPGTLNVAHTIPIALQAYLFINEVSVEIITLVVLIFCAVVGSYVGASFIARFNKKQIQFIMGVALILVAAVMLSSKVGVINSLAKSSQELAQIKTEFSDQYTTGSANVIHYDGVVYMLVENNDEIIPAGFGLYGYKLILAAVIFFILGALMSAGVGLYAPAMAVIYIFGLSPIVAFPIMMGSCAFLMPVAGIRFIKSNSYDKKLSLGIAFGGIFGVLIAFFVVKSIPTTLLTYIIIFVVIVVGVIMLLESTRKQKAI